MLKIQAQDGCSAVLHFQMISCVKSTHLDWEGTEESYTSLEFTDCRHFCGQGSFCGHYDYYEIQLLDVVLFMRYFT